MGLEPGEILGTKGNKPVTEALSRFAIHAIVGFDLLEKMRLSARIRLVAMIHDQAVVAGPHASRPLEAKIRFERFQRVAWLADLKGMPHNLVKIDESLLAKQIIEK